MCQHGITRSTLLVASGLTLLGVPLANFRAASIWTGLGADNDWGTVCQLRGTGKSQRSRESRCRIPVANSSNLISMTFAAAAGAFLLGGGGITLGGSIGSNGNPAAAITKTVNLSMDWSTSETIDALTNENLTLLN
jgi:hypothetical protein